MNKFILIITAKLLSCLAVQSQGLPPSAPSAPSAPSSPSVTTDCASGAIHEALLTADPSYATQVELMNQMALAYSAGNVARNDDEIFTIPVVVHVIHLGEPVGTGSNISDAQILSGIQSLNNDFRKIIGTNGDGAGVDTNMEFCLAMRTPMNLSTSGIVRVDGRVVTGYEASGIEVGSSPGGDEAAVKGLSTWPGTSYINIWVVSEIGGNDAGSGVQGYAYFPTSSPLDGIVLLHNVFGTVGNVKITHNQSRTCTHEMGHVFSLYHTHDSTTNCNAEIDCAVQGDRCCDTPVTTESASCNTPACSGTAQVNNYLSYSVQPCRNMFTNDQKDRMRGALINQRASLMTSIGCVPVSSLDVGVTAIGQPAGSSCNTTVNPSVTLTNFGSNTVTSATIAYNISGMVFGTHTWTGSLASGASAIVSLPAVISPFGTHTFSATASNPNGQTDENSSNNEGTQVFTIVNGSTVTISASLDFFGGQNSWQIKDLGGVVLASGGPYPNNQQGITHTGTACLSEGCFTFHFYDSGGNGMSFLSGSYQLIGPGNVVLASGSGNFGSAQNHEFCVVAPPVSGGPTAAFTQSATQTCQGGSVSFTNESSGSQNTYLWTFPGGTPSSSTATNPTVTYGVAGSYSVTLTATNAGGGDTETIAGLIGVSGSPVVTPSTTNVTCNGLANGMAVLAISGSSAPFAVSWSNGMSGSSIAGLAPGSHTAFTTNSIGCSTQTVVSISQPSALNITVSGTNVTCAGAASGSSSASATGGTGSKTFVWSNGQTGAAANNLAAGTYSVTVTDANGCSAQGSVTITQPTILSVTATATGAACSGSANGSATAVATGGTGGKTYTWSNGQTGATAINLAAGSYTVTATDAVGCTAQSSISVTQPGALSISVAAINATCSGLATGSATATATGGTGNKTFAWSNGQSGTTVNNLPAGNYTVTTADANGCTAQTSVTISQPSALAVTTSVIGVSCNGGNNGNASAVATGGTGNKTYFWSNGLSGATIGSLISGAYTVTATDANGCSALTNATITQPQALSLALNVQQIACGFENNGSILASANGGTGTKTYLWNTGQASQSISGLTAGDYTVTVTDANGCTTEETGTIIEPEGFMVTATKTNVTCFGAANGTATVTPNGGTGPISYMWTNGQTGSSITGLAPGVHIVVATDASGCVAETGVSITQPALLTASSSAIPAICFGSTTGSASATSAGGTSPKAFAWSNGQLGSNITGLNAGVYTVTVTDANGCTAQSSANVTQPITLAVSIVTSNVTCNGSSNGTATATAAGGTGNKTFIWSTGQSGPTVSSLSSGAHTVTVTDINGCTAQAVASITQPAALTVTTAATQVTCNGTANGTASATATGGTGSKTYSWSTGQSGTSISGLAAGNYTVVVTDQNNCTAQSTATVNQNSNLAVTLTANSPTCFGLVDGSASAVSSGGSGQHSYLWSNGATGQSVSNLSSGNYNVVVTDGNGCSFTSAFELTSPVQLAITVSDQEVSCAGQSNGSASAIVTGGSGQTTLLWSTGQSGTFVGNLTAGNYSVSGTDENGCLAQASFSISEPITLSLSLSVQQPTCYGLSNGSISSSASGGIGVLSYLWSQGSVGPSLAGVGSGLFTLTVSDGNSCTAQASAEVLAPVLPELTVTTTNASCFGATDGTAAATLTGMQSNATLIWSTGQTGLQISGLTAGNYSVSANDANGCSIQSEFTISQPGDILLTVVNTHLTCHGAGNGQAVALASGGSGEKFYSWSNGQTGPQLTGVPAGTYQVTVTDQNNCLVQHSTTVIQPDQLLLETTPVAANCFGAATGSSSAEATGGTGEVQFVWSNGMTGSFVSALSAGVVLVTATDQNGCTAQASVVIGQPELLLVSPSAGPVSCTGGADGHASLEISGGQGPFVVQWSNGLNGTTLSDLSSGTYLASVSDQNGCSAQALVFISEPSALQVQMTVTDVTCNGLNDGHAEASVTGGLGTYSYEWSNGSNSGEADGLSAGSHGLTVMDLNGCAAQSQFNISQPPAIALITTFTEPFCNGSSNGSATVSASGGHGLLLFNWSTGQTSSVLNDIPAGTFSVTVSDTNGCQSSALVSVTQPSILTAEIAAFNIGCGNSGSGSAMLVASGGTTPYSGQWSNGNQGMETDGLATGDYHVILNDFNGCEILKDFSIIESTQLSVVTIANGPACFGQSSGSVEAMAGGGSGPYTYAWTTGATSPEVSGLTSGSYTVAVTDSEGCSGLATVTLQSPSILTVAVVVMAPETCTTPGHAIALAQGGTDSYGYEWSDGSSSDETHGSSGSYVVVVRDGNLCQASASEFIPIDCIQPVPETYLDETSCGATDLQISQMVSCVEVPEAELYQWYFVNEAIGMYEELYSVSNSTDFALMNVPNIQYGIVIEVSVRALVSGQWGEYGSVCLIGMSDQVTSTTLASAYCGATELAIGGFILAVQVPGSTEYEWEFVRDSEEQIHHSFVNQLSLTQSSGFESGAVYKVRVRAKVGSIWGEFGDECGVSMAQTVGMTEIGPENTVLFPNPFDGLSFTVQFSQILGRTAVLTITNSAGQKVHEKVIEEGSESAQIQFDSQLANGVYTVSLQSGSAVSNYNMVVN